MKERKFLNRIADGMPTAIAEKNNEVLVQKISGEMMELFFCRYLGVYMGWFAVTLHHFCVLKENIMQFYEK